MTRKQHTPSGPFATAFSNPVDMAEPATHPDLRCEAIVRLDLYATSRRSSHHGHRLLVYLAARHLMKQGIHGNELHAIGYESALDRFLTLSHDEQQALRDEFIEYRDDGEPVLKAWRATAHP